MKKLLLLLLLTSSFSAYSDDVVFDEDAYPTHTSDDVINPACESKDINEELDRMWVKYGFYEMEVTAETIEEKDFLREYKIIFEGILRQRDEESIYKKGYYCCSNSSLEVCQELKEAKKL